MAVSCPDSKIWSWNETIVKVAIVMDLRTVDYSKLVQHSPQPASQAFAPSSPWTDDILKGQRDLDILHQVLPPGYVNLLSA